MNDVFGCAGKCCFLGCKFEQNWNSDKKKFETQCGNRNNSVKAHVYVATEKGRAWLRGLTQLAEQSEGHSVDDPIELMSDGEFD